MTKVVTRPKLPKDLPKEYADARAASAAMPEDKCAAIRYYPYALIYRVFEVCGRPKKGNCVRCAMSVCGHHKRGHHFCQNDEPSHKGPK